MSVEWYGYPQPDDAHPVVPWWRGPSWTRSDGLLAPSAIRDLEWDAPGVTDGLQAEDTAEPLPAPAAIPGQVWLWVDGTYRVHRVFLERVEHPASNRYTFGIGFTSAMWPPLDAKLVVGPGEPWEPM